MNSVAKWPALCAFDAEVPGSKPTLGSLVDGALFSLIVSRFAQLLPILSSESNRSMSYLSLPSKKFLSVDWMGHFSLRYEPGEHLRRSFSFFRHIH